MPDFCCYGNARQTKLFVSREGREGGEVFQNKKARAEARALNSIW
jgi:hypothetical protein